ncbi:MAG: hypothetical protein L3J05_01335, partial [Robiginitomaculum sp.]|nr:hypothetical protein [Robiginitomaculum sp.]
MLFKNFFFAFSQAYAASGKKIFISFFLHFIMSIATILGIALISLAARVSLNDDTEFLVRALRVPKELFHGNNIYAIFGVGFAMLMIAVLFSFLGRRVALDIESDVSSYLTDKIRRSITKYS